LKIEILINVSVNLSSSANSNSNSKQTHIAQYKFNQRLWLGVKG